jgi:hypothetical protein
VVSRVATLQELETHYSLADVRDVNDSLDAWEEARARASKPPGKG